MAQEYDKIFKENIEPLILSFAKKLLNINPDSLEEIPDDLQYTIEQKPDFLKKVNQPDGVDDYVLQIEFQTADSQKMLKRLLIYYGFIFREYDISAKQYVFYIGAKKYPAMVTELFHPDMWFRYKVISLANVDHEMFIHSDKPEEVLIAILCDFKNQSAERIIETILKRLKLLENDELELSRYTRQLEVLSKLRKLQEITIKKIEAMPIIYDLETDIRFLQGVEKGVNQGVNQGIEQQTRKQEEENKAKIIEMLKDEVLSTVQLAKYMNVSIEYVEELKKQLEQD